MKINIYYGGRGLIGDPTSYVIEKMADILNELNVKVERYDLAELKNSVTSLPQTLKDADGVILATTVEWYGIGGPMQQFLDACWLYGDKEVISHLYMCPVVMSTTYGEREGKLNLSVAWEILGGLPCSGICGYVPDITMIEMNSEYTRIIEKKAENLYRTINQKLLSFPASNQAVKQKVSFTTNIEYTPQETEQLSEYASDDHFVQKQKEDIQELSDLFTDMLESRGHDERSEYLSELKAAFQPQPGVHATYKVVIKGKNMPLIIKTDGKSLECIYSIMEKADVEMQMEASAFEEILAGRMTFQRGFMSGDMTMKGDHKLFRVLDQLFIFEINS